MSFQTPLNEDLRAYGEPDTASITLSAHEKDALGEIGNICMGTSATTLSTLLGKRVVITTPRVSISRGNEYLDEYEKPVVLTEVLYTQGIDGQNTFLLKKDDALLITDLLMGGDGTEPNKEELEEFCLSAVSEVMNQMVGSSSTALANALQVPVNISPPEIRELTDEERHEKRQEDDVSIVISFRMEIEDLLVSNIMQIMPLSFGKKLVQSLSQDIHSAEEKASSEAAGDSISEQIPADSAGGESVSEQIPAADESGYSLSQEIPASSADSESFSEQIPADSVGDESFSEDIPAADEGGYRLSQEIPAADAGGESFSEEIPAADEGGYSFSQEIPSAGGSSSRKAPQSKAGRYDIDEQIIPDSVKHDKINQEVLKEGAVMGMESVVQNTREQERNVELKAVQFQSFDNTAPVNLGTGNNIDLIMDVPLQVTVVLGKSKKNIKEILELGMGSVIVLDRLAGETVDVLVNGKMFAKGEVVVIDDNYGVRITEMAENRAKLF